MTKSKEERIKNAEYAKSFNDGEYVKGVGGKVVLNFKVAIFLCTISCLLFALAAPFILVLIQSGIKGYRLAEMFVDFYRYFILGGIFFVVLMVIEIYVFIRRKDLINNKQLGVLLSSVAVTIVFSVLFGSFISPYIMPVVLAGLLIAMLLERRLAMFANVLIDIAFFAYYVTVDPTLPVVPVVMSILIQAVSASLMIIVMSKHYTRGSFIVSAFFIGIGVAAPLAILSGLLINGFAWGEVLLNAVWSTLSTILGVALFMIVLPMMEKTFALYSNFRLEEICSPDAKLMKKLYAEAVGTYDHSAAVANLAEACAIKIGENHALAKAAAYYHDVGKLKHPLCFAENQKGYNPHDDFIPEVSIQMITDHTTYGAELIKKYNLPTILADMCIQHHGTTPVQYFYNKIRNITDDELEKEQFSYAGPKPQSRIAAILMIADTVESATRSIKDEAMDEDQLREFIHKLIDSKIKSGQFSECPITLKDLQDIETTLVERIPSINHKRIKYDNLRR